MSLRAALIWVGLALAASWLPWLSAAVFMRIDALPARLLGHLALSLGTVMPLALALPRLWRESDPAHWRGFWGRLLDPGRPGPLGWTWVLLPVPLCLLLGMALDLVVGGEGLVPGRPDVAPVGVLVALLMPLAGELAWRGYLLDRLQLTRSALTSALVVGLIWVLWWLPLLWVPGTLPHALAVSPPRLLLALGLLIPLSVVATRLYNASRGSLLAVVGLYAVMTGFLLAGGTSLRAGLFELLLWCALALLLVVLGGPASLLGARTTGAAARVVSMGPPMTAIRSAGSSARSRRGPARTAG